MLSQSPVVELADQVRPCLLLIFMEEVWVNSKGLSTMAVTWEPELMHFCLEL